MLHLFLLRVWKVFFALRSARLVRALLLHKVLAAAEHLHVVRQNSMTLVDVGANKGQFSLVYRTVHPESQIFAFEPLSLPAAKFEKLFAEDPHVIVFKCAVGSCSGTAEFHVSKHSDSSSLLPISSLQAKYFPGTDESHTQDVSVVRLSDVLIAGQIESPALLKIDVQGFELDVLRGAEDLLCHFDSVYCECSFVPLYSGQALAFEIIAFLMGHGLHVVGVYNAAYSENGSILQADFLFSRSPRVAQEVSIR